MSLTFRKATINDSAKLLVWRNDPDTRASAFNMALVTENEHKNWFAKVLAPDSLVDVYIVEKYSQPVATFRIDKRQEPYEISWSVAPEHRRKGLAKETIRFALEAANGEPVQARIKIQNIASEKAALAAGMHKEKVIDEVSYWAYIRKHV